MKTIPSLLPACFVATFFCSCLEKHGDEITPNQNPIPTDYTQLKVGNYWIYQRFNVDTNGNETATSVFDSCYVEKDSIINGKTYYKVYRPPYLQQPGQNMYYRDSLHYLVDVEGKIWFSSQDFSSLFDTRLIKATNDDTVCLVIRKMNERDKVVTVPAGTFVTSNCKTIYFMYHNWGHSGNPRRQNARYANNVGMVTETLPFFSVMPGYTERRLVRYHLN